MYDLLLTVLPWFKHLMLYYLQRNLETGEEPDCIALWELTHKKNGTWPNKEAQDVYVS
jgi:hypothetical protein